MEMINYKPLGSIINANGSNKKLMIIARALSVSLKKGEEKQFFDYACVTYPEGLISNKLFYVQDSEITKVLFEGFNDKENERAMAGLKIALEKLDMERYSSKYKAATQKQSSKENKQE